MLKMAEEIYMGKKQNTFEAKFYYLANTIRILNEKVKHLSFIRNSINYYSTFQIRKCVDICVCVGAIQFGLGQLKWLNNTHMVNSLVRPV